MKEKKEWEEESRWFVQTEAFTFILEHVVERVLVVVGNPGMGKSMLLQQTALSLEETEGYSVISCRGPSDVVSQFRKDTKQVFILDDACGKYKLVQSNLDQWKQYETKIARVLESKEVVILASCRSNVFREKQCRSVLIFSGRLCDLNDADCSLNKQEKLKIAKRFLSQNTIYELNSDLDSFDMFPLLCQLYTGRETSKSIRFFHNPFKFITNELNSFYREDGGLRCCSLFLCVINNGCLNQTILMDESESDFSQILRTILTQFGLNSGISRKSIRDSLDSLLKIYLKKRDGEFYILHDRLLDFLCYYFGQRHQQLMINYADSEIIRDRTLLKSLHTSPPEFTTLIDKKYEKDYIERLIKDMLGGSVDDVLYNHQMIYKDFRSKFVSHLQKLDEDELTVSYFLNNCFLENEIASLLSPVNFACKYGFRELFDFFLSKAKDINNYEGKSSPLITVCRKGDEYMTAMLLNKSANINQTDYLGCSPLMWSCVQGNFSIIEMLLDKGADVDRIEVAANPVL